MKLSSISAPEQGKWGVGKAGIPLMRVNFKLNVRYRERRGLVWGSKIRFRSTDGGLQS